MMDSRHRRGAARRRSGAASGRRSNTARTPRVDFELAAQIVNAAEAQWTRTRPKGRPMPLSLVLETYRHVLRGRGCDPDRDDHTLYQFLIKLQAEHQDKFRWEDKLIAAKKAHDSRRRRVRGKSGSTGAPRSMLIAEDRSKAALEELAKMPLDRSPRPRAEMWEAWRQWVGFVQFQRQRQHLQRSYDGMQPASGHQHPEPHVNLERSLDDELIQAADNADGSKSRPASGPSPAHIVSTPLSPKGVASLSSSHASRMETHKLLDQLHESAKQIVVESPGVPKDGKPLFKRDIQARGSAATGSAEQDNMQTSPGSEHQTSIGVVRSSSYKLMRMTWKAWREWLYIVASEQLGLVTQSDAVPKQTVAPGSLISSVSPAAEEATVDSPRHERDVDWAVAAQNLRRCGRRRAPSFNALRHAHFLVHKDRMRTSISSEAKLLGLQSARRPNQ